MRPIILMLTLFTAVPLLAADLVVECRGPLSPDATEKSLRAHFGSRNVAREEIAIGEGEPVVATIVHPDDPTRRIEIVWQDEERRQRPSQVRFGPDATALRGWEGIRLDMTLAELQEVNLGYFTLNAFDGSEAEGVVSTWNGGRLSRLGARMDEAPCTLAVTLTATAKPDKRARRHGVELESRDASVIAAKPVVQSIILVY